MRNSCPESRNTSPHAQRRERKTQFPTMGHPSDPRSRRDLPLRFSWCCPDAVRTVSERFLGSTGHHEIPLPDATCHSVPRASAELAAKMREIGPTCYSHLNSCFGYSFYATSCRGAPKTGDRQESAAQEATSVHHKPRRGWRVHTYRCGRREKLREMTHNIILGDLFKRK